MRNAQLHNRFAAAQEERQLVAGGVGLWNHVIASQKPRGVTLVELLVVITIILVIAAATLPRIKPNVDNQRIRESARMIHTYLSSARNQAISTGRPVGVMIERLGNTDISGKLILAESGCSTMLSQTEVPLPYAGGSANSFAGVNVQASMINAAMPNDFEPTLIKPGDQIQFGFQGPWYPIQSVTTTSGSTTLTASIPPNTRHPWDTNSATARVYVTYKILRQPSKSAVAPLQLPSPAVVDLTQSGIDGVSSWGIGSKPVMIVFSANGSVEGIYYEGVASKPTKMLCLLVGRRERVVNGAAFADAQGLNNLSDLNDRWVGINPATGLISTAEITVGDPKLLLRTGDSMGGK